MGGLPFVGARAAASSRLRRAPGSRKDRHQLFLGGFRTVRVGDAHFEIELHARVGLQVRRLGQPGDKRQGTAASRA